MAKKDELEFEGGVESSAPKPNNSEKLKALQAAMDKIEKSFGKGSIMKWEMIMYRKWRLFLLAPLR